MQQTVDAVAVTKDLTDAALATTLVSGLSYFLSSAVALVTTEADVAAMIAVSGSLSCYSAAADGEIAETIAVVAATICAANSGS